LREGAFGAFFHIINADSFELDAHAKRAIDEDDKVFYKFTLANIPEKERSNIKVGAMRLPAASSHLFLKRI